MSVCVHVPMEARKGICIPAAVIASNCKLSDTIVKVLGTELNLDPL